MAEAPQNEKKTLLNPTVRWIAMMIAAAAALVIAVRSVFSEQRVYALLEWIGNQGILAPVMFLTLQCLVIVTLAPGFVLSFAAGFLFGFWLGILYVWAGTLLGSLVAFKLGPLFLQNKSDLLMKRFPKLAQLDRGFSSDGWKIAMLRCLIPLFPFKLSNYAFGVSNIGLKNFALGTALGIIPIAAFNVYLGSISADLSTLGAGDRLHSKWEWVALAAGGVAIVVTLIFVTRRANAIFNPPPEQEDSASN